MGRERGGGRIRGGGGERERGGEEEEEEGGGGGSGREQQVGALTFLSWSNSKIRGEIRYRSEPVPPWGVCSKVTPTGPHHAVMSSTQWSAWVLQKVTGRVQSSILRMPR